MKSYELKVNFSNLYNVENKISLNKANDTAEKTSKTSSQNELTQINKEKEKVLKVSEDETNVQEVLKVIPTKMVNSLL